MVLIRKALAYSAVVSNALSVLAMKIGKHSGVGTRRLANARLIAHP
jgi:hypothetical protein